MEVLIGRIRDVALHKVGVLRRVVKIAVGNEVVGIQRKFRVRFDRFLVVNADPVAASAAGFATWPLAAEADEQKVGVAEFAPLRGVVDVEILEVGCHGRSP